MVTIEYTGGAPVWRCRAFGGITAHPSDPIDVNDAAAEALVDQHDFAFVESGSDDSTASASDADSQTITGTTASSDPDDGHEPTADAGGESADESTTTADDDAFVILENSVGELRDALSSGEFDDQLDELEQAEEERNGRQTALDAIDQRRNAIDG